MKIKKFEEFNESEFLNANFKYANFKSETPRLSYNWILESRGIPNILKKYSDEIFNSLDLKNLDKDNIIEYTFNDPDFNLNLLLKIANTKHKVISGYSIPEKIAKTSLTGIIVISVNFDFFDPILLKQNIVHELLHLYELYKRNDDIEEPYTWKINNTYLKKYSEDPDKSIKLLSHSIYLSLDHEISARVAEIYPVLYDLKTSNMEKLKTELKKTSAWISKENIKNFRIKSFDRDRMSAFFDGLYSLNYSKFPKKQDTIEECINSWMEYFQNISTKIEKRLYKILTEVADDIKRIENLDNNEIYQQYIDDDIKENYRDFFTETFSIEDI